MHNRGLDESADSVCRSLAPTTDATFTYEDNLKTTFIKDNGVDLFFVTETWLSAQGDANAVRLSSDFWSCTFLEEEEHRAEPEVAASEVLVWHASLLSLRPIDERRYRRRLVECHHPSSEAPLNLLQKEGRKRVEVFDLVEV